MRCGSIFSASSTLCDGRAQLGLGVVPSCLDYVCRLDRADHAQELGGRVLLYPVRADMRGCFARDATAVSVVERGRPTEPRERTGALCRFHHSGDTP